MKKIRLGVKKRNVSYDFRETCFGIVYKNGEFYLTEKDREISLVGGGVEKGETHIDTLKREFLEEAGLTITGCREFITIDCFWQTRNKKYMESLANFYIVEVSDNIIEATEKESKLVIAKPDNLEDKLLLPYQKEAIRLFFEMISKN